MTFPFEPLIGFKFTKPTIYLLSSNPASGKVKRCKIPVRQLLQNTRQDSLIIAQDLIKAHGNLLAGIKISQLERLLDKMQHIGPKAAEVVKMLEIKKERIDANVQSESSCIKPMDSSVMIEKNEAVKDEDQSKIQSIDTASLLSKSAKDFAINVPPEIFKQNLDFQKALSQSLKSNASLAPISHPSSITGQLPPIQGLINPIALKSEPEIHSMTSLSHETTSLDLDLQDDDIDFGDDLDAVLDILDDDDLIVKKEPMVSAQRLDVVPTPHLNTVDSSLPTSVAALSVLKQNDSVVSNISHLEGTRIHNDIPTRAAEFKAELPTTSYKTVLLEYTDDEEEDFIEEDVLSLSLSDPDEVKLASFGIINRDAAKLDAAVSGTSVISAQMMQAEQKKLETNQGTAAHSTPDPQALSESLSDFGAGDTDSSSISIGKRAQSMSVQDIDFKDDLSYGKGSGDDEDDGF